MNNAITKGTRCLFVFAHPDDELSCSSMLYYLARKDCSTHCVYLTHGDTAREMEGRASVGILMKGERNHERIEFCTYPDRRLQSVVPEIADLISKRIEELNPQLIVTHDPEDSHSDHRAVYSAVEIATRYLPISHIVFGGPSTNSEKFEANLFLQLNSDVMQRKLEAAHVHQSKSIRPYVQTQYITGMAMSWKYQYPFLATRSEKFYEAFRLVRIEAPLEALSILLSEQCGRRSQNTVPTHE